MDYYLFLARSVTHAQRMAKVMSAAGVSSKIRRTTADITERGCGYTLQVPLHGFARARDACRAGGVLPVRVLRVSGEKKQEVAL